MGACKPDFFDVFSLRSRASVCVFGQKFNPSFVEGERVAEGADVFHAICRLGEARALEKAD